MRNVRRALNLLRPRAYRGDASSRISIALALAVVVLVALYVAWLGLSGHGR